MSVLGEARAHLAKAEEFLAAAELSAEFDHMDAATSSAVISGINAKDAICLALTGSTGKSDDHRRAVTELRRAGPDTTTHAANLGRLLRLKNRSQYQATTTSRSDASSAVGWARVLCEGAKEALADR